MLWLNADASRSKGLLGWAKMGTCCAVHLAPHMLQSEPVCCSIHHQASDRAFSSQLSVLTC